MRNVPALLRRELNAYFASAIGYVMLMFFLLVMGFMFREIVKLLTTTGPTQRTVMEMLFTMFWLPAMVVIPVITMRLLAEEKRSGTMEMLMTAPVTDVEVVLAKWLGAVVLYSLMWGATGVYVVVLRQCAAGPMGLDLGPVLCGYVGVLLVGQFLIAVGVLASSLTKNQVLAALTSFAAIFLFLIVCYWQTMTSSGDWAQLFRFLAAFDHVEDFARGLLDTRPVVLYVTGTVVVLFASVRVVESRKWR